MPDGFVHLSLQQIGLVLLVFALVTFLLEERLASLDAVFHGFLAPGDHHLRRLRLFVLGTAITLGVASLSLLALSLLGV